jgi:hypothetical protein
VPTRSRRRRLTAGVAVACAIALAIGIYVAVRQVKPLFTASGCHAGAGRGAVTLQPDQAANAATIAAVAHQRAMPRRAVTIAYAAAMQESHLHDVQYGDRDSVGIFQQRPSQGWGPARRLRDPVYAATRFFQALATVHGYQRMPVYRAAQAVQHSADGYAYSQYQPLATELTTAFTGKAPHSVWCWPTGSGAGSGRANLAAAQSGLVQAFGPLSLVESGVSKDAPSLLVRTGHGSNGWAVAAWLVTHAGKYRLHEVRYAGLVWRSSSGHSGWAPDRGAGTAGADGKGSHPNGTDGEVVTN